MAIESTELQTIVHQLTAQWGADLLRFVCAAHIAHQAVHSLERTAGTDLGHVHRLICSGMRGNVARAGLDVGTAEEALLALNRASQTVQVRQTLPE